MKHFTKEDVLQHNSVLNNMLKNNIGDRRQMAQLPGFLADVFNYIHGAESYKEPRHAFYRRFLNDINIERHCRTIVVGEIREILAKALVGSPIMQNQTAGWKNEDYLSFFQRGFVSTYKFTCLMLSKHDSTRIVALTKTQVLQSLYILMASRIDIVSPITHCLRDWRDDQKDLYYIICLLPSILFRDGLDRQFSTIEDTVHFSGLTKRQLIKPVKFLRAAFPTLTEQEAALVGQTVADTFRQEFLKSIEAVKVSNFPSAVYTEKHSSSLRSCMKNKDDEVFELYNDLPNATIAYIDDEDGCIIARALLHDEVRNEDTGEIIKVMDRIYAEDGDCEAMMINYAKVHGYYRKIRQALNIDRYVAPDMKPGDDYVDLPNMSIAAPRCKPNTYSAVPYIDTFNEYSMATPGRLYTSLTDEQRSDGRCFTLCNDDGKVEGFTIKVENCAHCACTINLNDPESYFFTEDDEYVCNDCFEDKYFQCDYCDRCFCEDYTTMHKTPDGDIVCESCFNDKWCTCDACGDIISNNDAKVVESGGGRNECYCEGCYDGLVKNKKVVETISGNTVYVCHAEKINEGTNDECYETLLNFSKRNIKFCETCLRFFTREYISQDNDLCWTCCHCHNNNSNGAEN